MRVIFDMDGTLLRLEVDIEEARLRLAALFKPHGVTRPFRPILRRIREAAREAGDEALVGQGMAVLDELEVAAARSARARGGAVEVARALVDRGDVLGIVTDNGRACVPVALAAAGLDPRAFRAVITRDDVPAPKPDPAGVVACATAMAGSRPDGPVWYVGDHPRDVEAGRAAAKAVPGLKVAALVGGYAAEADLRAAGADAVLAELRGVLRL